MYPQGYLSHTSCTFWINTKKTARSKKKKKEKNKKGDPLKSHSWILCGSQQTETTALNTKSAKKTNNAEDLSLRSTTYNSCTDSPGVKLELNSRTSIIIMQERKMIHK